MTPEIQYLLLGLITGATLPVLAWIAVRLLRVEPTRPASRPVREAKQHSVVDKILSHPVGSSVNLSEREMSDLLRETEVTSVDWNEFRALFHGTIDTIFGRKIIRG